MLFEHFINSGYVCHTHLKYRSVWRLVCVGSDREPRFLNRFLGQVERLLTMSIKVAADCEKKDALSPSSVYILLMAYLRSIPHEF